MNPIAANVSRLHLRRGNSARSLAELNITKAGAGVSDSSREIVIIGASNVTLAMPTLWHSLSRNQSLPDDNLSDDNLSDGKMTDGKMTDGKVTTRLYITAGHGRSYGLPSTVLGRTLPSILESGLWTTLESTGSPTTSPVALVTDIGNDLLYAAPVDYILEWVTTVCQRLAARGCRLVITLPPMASLRTLSPQRYYFFRRVLFPQAKLSFDDAMERAGQLSEGVSEIAAALNAVQITPSGDWYGLDPIHIRRTFRARVWSELLNPLIPGFEAVGVRPVTSVRTWRLRPAVRWRWQQLQTTDQPVQTRRDSELWLF